MSRGSSRASGPSLPGAKVYAPVQLFPVIPAMAHFILVVDDEPDIRSLVQDILADDRYYSFRESGGLGALNA